MVCLQNPNFLDGLGMEHFGIFYFNLVFLRPFGTFKAIFVYFIVIL
jgi:hypothetical protein